MKRAGTGRGPSRGPRSVLQAIILCIVFTERSKVEGRRSRTRSTERDGSSIVRRV